jgi:very-short-patch-repair endonuclease
MTSKIKKKISKTLKKLIKNKKIKRWNIKRKNKSYAENFFYQFLINNGFKYKNDFFTEFPFSLYRADFFFPRKKLVIEIDGQQHLEKERRLSDLKKDKHLSNLGIKVFRISWLNIFHNSKESFNEILKVLNTTKNTNLLIKNFTKKQIKLLKHLTKIKKQLKKIKIKKRIETQKKKNQKREKYITDLKHIKIKRGFIAKLSKKWDLSHTQIRRILKSLRKEKDP